MYKYIVKRLMDIIFSVVGIIVMFPVFILISAAVYIDDPGPVLFRQKRIGKNKKFFTLHKFRSMKRSAPDLPTHMLTDPEQYITRVGAFIRRTSLDELPQLFDILRHKMTFIGPRPALWNQEDLIAEREKYGANDVLPGLTGWAQINGRDELEIFEKAKLDGDYTAALNAGHFKGLAMDIRCFFRTFRAVLRADGVVEGGTGAMEPENRQISDGENVLK